MIQSLIDLGGVGRFASKKDKIRFYANNTISYTPIELGVEKNLLHHPIIEKRLININGLKHYGVFSAVGGDSLHRLWMSKTQNFDIHLIVYDNSWNEYKNDSNFVTYKIGRKYKLLYEYFKKNPLLIEKYDYFYFPDDDIKIDTSNIEKLFEYMRKFKLEIAQPALTDSYYSFNHTIKNKQFLLRYTNFVEMMQPCFSREALKKVLFTFNENESGWGIDYHWSKLVSFSGIEMAIIDDVFSIHTRTIQSVNNENVKELNRYLGKYNLNHQIHMYNAICKNIDQCDSFWRPIQITTERLNIIEEYLEWIASVLVSKIDSVKTKGLFNGTLGIALFFFEYYHISSKRKYFDVAVLILKNSISDLSLSKNDISFANGIAGISWVIEYLAQHGLIKNNTNEILNEFVELMNLFNIHQEANFDLKEGLAGNGIQLIARVNNPLILEKNSEKFDGENKLTEILNIIDLVDGHFSKDNLLDVVLLLCPFCELDNFSCRAKSILSK